MTTGHKHVDLMRQYVEDAAKSETPWEFWEFRGWEFWEFRDWGGREASWISCKEHPSWIPENSYRRKPETVTKTITIPKPATQAPKPGQAYWVPSLIYPDSPARRTWCCDSSEISILYKGLVHTTKAAAVEHGQALLSTTKESPCNS